MKAAADSRQDTSGWANVCVRPVAPGQVCGLRYWYVAVSRKRLERDLSGPHTCRQVAG